jgi:N-hydroxyarylamine O-acetyltransferase
MSEFAFDTAAWLGRIGFDGSPDPTLPTLRAVIAAHSATIPFENIDVLLGRPPKLDLGSLKRKMIEGGRGGYCFEQNTLLHAGLTALGFRVTRLLARVIRGMEHDATGPQTHMALRVDLPEGPFLADVGFGNVTPTAPLAMQPGVEQETPHEPMRFLAVGEELTLQVKLGLEWQNTYRVAPHPRLPVDYEVANWFTATHPGSPFVGNLIAARPGPGGARNTLFNGRVSVRGPSGPPRRFMLGDPAEFRTALADTFGVTLTGADLSAALEVLDRKGARGATHPFFS